MVFYRDEGRGDVASVFVAMMYEEYNRLHDPIWAEEPMNPTTEQEKQAFDSSRSCCSCNSLSPRTKLETTAIKR